MPSYVCLKVIITLISSHPLLTGYSTTRFVGEGRFCKVYAIRSLDNPTTELILKAHEDSNDAATEQHILLSLSKILPPELLPAVPTFVSAHGKYTPVCERNQQITKADLAILIEILKVCHSNGIWHRDISPDNILRTATGTILLSDWGSAVSSPPDQMAIRRQGGAMALVQLETPDELLAFWSKKLDSPGWKRCASCAESLLYDELLAELRGYCDDP